MSIYLAIFGKPRYMGLVKIEEHHSGGTWVLLKTMRGFEMGLLGGSLSPDQEEKYRKVGRDDREDGSVQGAEPMLQEVSFVRPASQSEIELSVRNRKEEDEALIKSRILLTSHNLPIKLVEVEYLYDKKKLFFYFTAESRVDFRAYVRDLAREFRTRIEMRQIGVRDEARTAKGMSPCGQPCCCSYWLHKFTPICIRMVKEQNLALNPTKISGLCGRLMCCMSFEHEMYEEIWKKLPNPGAKLKSPDGNYIIDGVNLKNETVSIRYPGGKLVPIPVSDFEQFKQTILSGGQWELPDDFVMPRTPTPKVRQARENNEVKEQKAQKEQKTDKNQNSPAEIRRSRISQKRGKISLEEHLAAVAAAAITQKEIQSVPEPEHPKKQYQHKKRK